MIVSEDIQKMNSESSEALRRLCKQYTETIKDLMLQSNALAFYNGDNIVVFHLPGPREFEAVYYYLLDSFEYIYFEVNKYITSSRTSGVSIKVFSV